MQKDRRFSFTAVHVVMIARREPSMISCIRPIGTGRKECKAPRAGISLLHEILEDVVASVTVDNDDPFNAGSRG